MDELILHNFCPWDGHPFAIAEICCPICGSERSSSPYYGPIDPLELASISSSSKHSPRWRKVLYQKQPFEDNYTDTTFLIGLIRNANLKVYDYWTLVKESSTITQQLATVMLFLLLFYLTWNGNLSLQLLLVLEMLSLFCGIIGFATINEKFRGRSILRSLRSILLLVSVLYCLSPIIATLTNSFTNDTIFALTFMLLSIHLVAQDYGYLGGSGEKFSAPISLNAGIFASVLLSSRLTSHLHVFALIFLSTQLFALFPIFRHYCKKKYPEWQLWLTTILLMITLTLSLFFSFLISLVYLFGVLFATFVAPAWLIFIQKYKNEINGPWDEAVPMGTSDLLHR